MKIYVDTLAKYLAYRKGLTVIPTSNLSNSEKPNKRAVVREQMLVSHS